MIFFISPELENYYRKPSDCIGIIPEFLDPTDERPAREQIDEGYAHGGGWHEFNGFSMDPESYVLSHEGDPDLPPLVIIPFREEVIALYPSAWTAIIQQDGSYTVARLD